MLEVNQLTSCADDTEDSRYKILYESSDENGAQFPLREWDIYKENSVADVLMHNNNFKLWMLVNVEEVRN